MSGLRGSKSERTINRKRGGEKTVEQTRHSSVHVLPLSQKNIMELTGAAEESNPPARSSKFILPAYDSLPKYKDRTR